MDLFKGTPPKFRKLRASGLGSGLLRAGVVGSGLRLFGFSA